MAQPKKKTSNSKQWHRRSQWKAEAPNLTTCPHCHAPALQHTICQSCGTVHARWQGRCVRRPGAGASARAAPKKWTWPGF